MKKPRTLKAADVDKFLRDLERELPVTLSLREVASVMKCSTRTVSRLIASGDSPSIAERAIAMAGAQYGVPL